MPESIQNQYREPYPVESTSAKDSAPADIDYRDIAYVYAVTMQTSEMGDQYEEWAHVASPVRCSFQEHALDSQHVDPNNAGSRYALLFCREPNAIRWHDKIIVRGAEYLVTKSLDRFDNFNGKFHHAEIRAKFLQEPYAEPDS